MSIFLFWLSLALHAALPKADLLTLTSPSSTFVPPADRPLVAIFVSATCPCSDAHVEHIKQLSREFPDFAFVGVHANKDEAPADTEQYFAGKSFPFPIARDAQQEWANALKAHRTPHAFVFSKSGELLYQGGVSSSMDPLKAKSFPLRQALAALARGQKPPRERSRVLGCPIAR